MDRDATDDGIALVGLSKSFRTRSKSIQALVDIDLAINRSEFVTVIGRSGCGKSTLLRVIAGLTEPEAGSVTIFGSRPVVACADKDVGFVPQSPALLPWRTVLGNARLPLEINRRGVTAGPGSRREPIEILRAFGLGEVLDRRPSDLSGGMAQRVAIARAFSFGPSLLLMDEPFSALDELTREELQHDLLEQWQKERQTVVFVTHSVTEAVLLGDRVIVMSRPPHSIVADIAVNLARPRPDLVELSDPFREIERVVRDALQAGDRAER